MIRWLTCFSFAVCQDFLATWFTLSVTSRRPLTASLCAMAITLCSYATIYWFVQNRRTLLPTATGHGLGVFLAMSWMG